MTVTATLSPDANSGVVSLPPGQSQETTPPASATTPPAQTATQPPAANAPNPNRPSWADQNWTDDDQRQWDAKGFKTPIDVWKFAVNAQKAATDPNRVRLPKPGDEAAQKDFFKAIGVPDSPDKYEITVPEQNGSKDLADAFRTTAHKLGLTPDQAKGLNEFWNGYVAQNNAKTQELSDTEFSQMVDTAKQKLRNEWGPNYETNYGAAQRALVAAQLPPDAALAMEYAIGTENMIRMFSNLGMLTGEKGLVTPGVGEGGFGKMTVAEARAKIQEFQKDDKRMAALSSDMQARRETPDAKMWIELHKILAQAN